MRKVKGCNEMLGQQNREEALLQNLEDAGCASDTIELFMQKHEQSKLSEQLKILSKQRCVLLDDVHKSQKKLDCLDYLIYRLKDEAKG
jgi:hypothetical protein